MTTPATHTPGPRKRGLYVHRLHTANGVRLELCRLYKAMRREEIDTLDGHRMAGVLHLIYRVIEGSEVMRRLEELERIATDRQGRIAA